MITELQALRWLTSGKNGMSSEAMLRAAMVAQGGAVPDGLARYSRTATPMDVADFGRCYNLLKEIPEVANQWDAIAALGPTWAIMRFLWPRWTAMYAGNDLHDTVRLNNEIQTVVANAR